MTVPIDPDRTFAQGHVPGPVRPALAALWALDATLGAIVSTTTNPMVGQLRLTWWHEALSSLTPNATRAPPELDALARFVVGTFQGPRLAMLVEGWEELLEPMPLSDDALANYARGRGQQVFEYSAVLLGGRSDAASGRGWALADFAARCSDPATATRAWDAAAEAFGNADAGRMPRPLRIIARLAAGDVTARARGERSAWRLLRSVR